MANKRSACQGPSLGSKQSCEPASGFITLTHVGMLSLIWHQMSSIPANQLIWPYDIMSKLSEYDIYFSRAATSVCERFVLLGWRWTRPSSSCPHEIILCRWHSSVFKTWCGRGSSFYKKTSRQALVSRPVSSPGLLQYTENLLSLISTQTVKKTLCLFILPKNTMVSWA